jgi:O-antigen ligase
LNQYLDILAVIGFVFFVFSAFKNLENSILIGILIKSLIDGAWDVKFAGFSLIDLHSVIFILYSLQLIYKNNLFHLIDKQFNLLWLLSHLGVFFLFVTNPLSGIDGFARLLFFPISLILIPYFILYCEEETSTKLLKYMIYASLFSSIISVLQFIGLIPHEFEHMTKGLSRSNGFFHDMVTSRIYVMQGLIVLSYIKFSGKYEINSFLSYLLLILFAVAGYALFSKALIGIFILGGILLIFTTKQNPIQLIIGIVLAFLILISNTEILESTNQLFVKEINYNEGELDDSGQLFSGRGLLWDDYIKMYEESEPLEKIIGLSMNDGRTHNEYLRILILSGLIGLIAYIFFSILIIYKSFFQMFRKADTLFTTLFCASILIIDSVSVVWGLYPFYLITIFGFFQLTIKENDINYSDESTDTKTRIW